MYHEIEVKTTLNMKMYEILAIKLDLIKHAEEWKNRQKSVRRIKESHRSPDRVLKDKRGQRMGTGEGGKRRPTWTRVLVGPLTISPEK